jgi:hypothetical protein
MTSEALVDWYVSNKTFDNFSTSETERETFLDTSADNFFAELKKEAKGGNKLDVEDYREIIKGKIENEANDKFNEKLKEKIDSANLKVPDLKDSLYDNVGDYDSLDQVDDDVEAANDYLEGLKDRFSGAETAEERELAREELRAEAPSVYGGLRSGESRAANKALAFITG